MTKTAAIYVALHGLISDEYVQYTLTKLAEEVDTLVIITHSGLVSSFEAQTRKLKGRRVVAFRGSTKTVVDGYRSGLAYLQEDKSDFSHIVLTGNQVFGPIRDEAGWLKSIFAETDGAWAPYWHNLDLETRLTEKFSFTRLPHFDFLVLGPKALGNPDFMAKWQAIKPSIDYWEEFSTCWIPIGKALRELDIPVGFPAEVEEIGTIDPSKFEAHKIAENPGVVIPKQALHLDPVLHDANATYVREALERVNRINPTLGDIIYRHALGHMPGRVFGSIADQYEILPDQAASPDKREWSFGTVAVFIHAFYANMMPEFWEQIEKLPCRCHLFITTSKDEDKAEIERFLAEKDWPEDLLTVRLVEVNRGRDMSSLFITFRDIILSDEFEVALRLHSKRTPQVSRQVAISFKDHLFDNLVGNSGYVSNLLDTLEENPDVGLVIPPVIHIGFATLGHSWFANRRPLEKLMNDMKIKVPLDEHTPLAPYGTMFWFRTKALRIMFEWKWKWTDYNPEPHHIDGGLAHVQERLIGVVPAHHGYRTLTIMNTQAAARNYAKLEYKYQLLASYLPSGNLYLQQEHLSRNAKGVKMSAYHFMRDVYARILVRYPASRGPLKPVVSVVNKLMAR